MTLKQTFLDQAHGDVMQAAEALARGLMEGDPASFKAGYSAESAAASAVEVFSLDRTQAAQLALALDANWDLLARTIDRPSPSS